MGTFEQKMRWWVLFLLPFAFSTLRGEEKHAEFHSTDFDDSKSCQRCHPRQYLEWNGSAHAYSLLDPIFRALQKVALEDGGEEVGSSCLECHSPVGVRSGELPTRFEASELTSQVREGVSCLVCHRVEGPGDPGSPSNANFKLSPGDVLLARLYKPVDTQAHGSASSSYVAGSGFCGTCHDVFEGSRRVESTFTEWADSDFRRRPVECNDCHMLRYSGRAATKGPFRDELRRHNFPGVTLPPPGFPNRGYQEEEIRKFLRTAARISVRHPEVAKAGGALTLTVGVKNSGTGHNLPAASFRQMWIEVTALDAQGNVFFRSGHLDAKGHLMDHHSELRPGADVHLVQFADYHIDQDGKEVPHWRATGLKVASLRPLEVRRATYPIPVPVALDGSRLKTRVRLLFRSFASYKLRGIGLEGMVKELPVFEIDSYSASLPVLRNPPRPKRYFVPEDFPGPQVALDALRDGDTVSVAPGEYVLEKPLDFAGKRIRLVSREGPRKTVLRLADELPDSEWESVVVFRNGEGLDTRLEGFGITGGRGSLIEGRRRGGGIYIRRSSPTIVRNRITGCGAAEGFGGGIACSGGQPEISGNEIESCWAEQGGGMAYRGADGQGIVLAENSIQGNIAQTGGGLFIDRGTVRIERGVFAGNRTRGAGAAVFAGEGAVLEVDHATVVQNRGRAGSGPIHAADHESFRASNSIFRANRPSQTAESLSYCLVGGVAGNAVSGGTDNRAGSPLFVDAAGRWLLVADDEPNEEANLSAPAKDWPSARRWVPGNYHLLQESPAIDQGDPDAPADPDDTRTDIGAFFFEQRLRGFVRGDVDGDGKIAWPDLLLLAQHLATREELPCRDAADLDDGGSVDLGDALLLEAHLMTVVLLPMAPFPDCGLDPTPGDGLSCMAEPTPCRQSP